MPEIETESANIQETAPVTPETTETTDAGQETAGKETTGKETEGKETAKSGDKPKNILDGKDKPGEKTEEIKDGIPEDYDKVELDIENLDPAARDGFAKISRDLQLTTGQMQALAKWQDGFVRQTRETMTAEGISQLQKEMGPQFESRRQAALNMIIALDQNLDGEFGAALGRCGALCDPAIVKGFMTLAQAFSEDSLGQAAEGAAPLRTETAYEGLRDAFAKAGK